LDSVQNCLYSQNLENSSTISISSQASTHGILNLLLVKEQLQNQNSKSSKIAMINAFLLAWFTHLTTKILMDLQLNLFGPDAMMQIFRENDGVQEKSEIEPEADELVKIENDHEENNGSGSGSKKVKKGDLRRRRRRIQNGNESNSEGMMNFFERREVFFRERSKAMRPMRAKRDLSSQY
jgi:hypothetical protein